jgi:hypothetical protein
VTAPEHEYTHELIDAARATALHAEARVADGAVRG